jgi:hypothetical protein
MADETLVAAENAIFWRGVRLALRRAIVVLVGLGGLVGAAHATDRAGYDCGLGAFVAACLVLFVEMKRHWDGLAPLSLGDLLIDDFGTLAVGLPLLALFALACLFVAADGRGGAGYYAGLGGAIAAVLVALGSIGACFDRAEVQSDGTP